jgi:hypothetical protein
MKTVADITDFLRDFISQGANSLMLLLNKQTVSRTISSILLLIAVFIQTLADVETGQPLVSEADWVLNMDVKFYHEVSNLQASLRYNDKAMQINEGGFVRLGGDIDFPTLALVNAKRDYLGAGLYSVKIRTDGELTRLSYVTPEVSVNKLSGEGGLLAQEPCMFHRLHGLVGNLGKDPKELCIDTVLPTFIVRQPPKKKAVYNKDYWHLKVLTLSNPKTLPIKTFPKPVIQTKTAGFISWFTTTESTFKGNLYETNFATLYHGMSPEVIGPDGATIATFI